MNKQYPDSWKQHIDPELDSTVKSFLRYLKIMKDFAHDGHLSKVNQVSNNSVMNSPGWTSHYSQNFMEDVKKIDPTKISFLNDIIAFAEPTSEPDKFYNRMRQMAAKLPAASNAYYLMKINSIAERFPAKYFNNTVSHDESTLRPALREISSAASSLMCTYMFQEIDKLLSEDCGVNPFENPVFANLFLSSFFSMMSQIANKNSINELLAKGDNESICKAVRIDKTVLNTELVKKRIAEETLDRKSTFLDDLGAASAEEGLLDETHHYRTYMVLKVFWLTGINTLGHKDLYYFLCSCGLTPPNYPDGIRKFLERNIYPIYGK